MHGSLDWGKGGVTEIIIARQLVSERVVNGTINLKVVDKREVTAPGPNGGGVPEKRIRIKAPILEKEGYGNEYTN